MQVVEIAFTGYSVTDMKRAKGFYEGLLGLYGRALGLRNARKHLGWYLQHWPGGDAWRQRLLTLEEPAAVQALLPEIFLERREAA